MQGMTAKRALWEATATVVLADVFVSSLVTYLLRAEGRSFEWSVYLILFIVPLPLIFLVYYRYRRGAGAADKPRSPKYHVTWAAAYLLIGIAIVTDAMLRHRHGSDLTSQLLQAGFWLSVAIERLHKAVRAVRGGGSSGPTIAPTSS